MAGAKALRVLMTADAVGGVWVYASGLARTLAQRGCEVLIVTLGPRPRSDQLRVLSGKPGVQVEVTDLALEWMDPEGADFPRARSCLAEIARRFEPDVVHLNGYREALVDWYAPVVVVAHSCVLSWWQACHGDAPSESKWSYYAGNVAAGLAAADAWVACSAAFRDAVQEIYIPDLRGEVIWNGIETTRAHGEKDNFIFAAGRLWDPAKNVAAVTAVASKLDWPVRIAGPLGSGSEAQASPVRRNGRTAEFLGELPHDVLLAHMQRASIFVAPALYEPFGLSVLEAAASGCALVLSDISTFRELWDDAALFVRPHDQEALATALNSLGHDHGLRERLQYSAVTRAQQYRLSNTADAYLRLYSRLSAQRSRAAATPSRIPAMLETAR